MTSSGPLTSFSLSLALACKNKSDRDFCVASVLRELLVPFLKIFNSFFLDSFGFLQVSVHLFTMPLKFFLSFCSVFGKVPFNVQFCQRLVLPFFPWLQAAPHQVFSSGFPCLFPEHPPLILHLASYSLEFSSYLFPSVLSFCVVFSWPRSREIFFLIALALIALLLSASSPSFLF